MTEITLKIDNKEVKGKAGDTILEVCKANGIYIPTLCHLEGLSEYGACRICLVEDLKQGKLVPSCATPAAEGMEILTNTEKLKKYRRMVIELLLSERNHFCFFCEKSGDCELQSLAYEFGIDHVRFSPNFNPLPVDSTNDYIVIDNNRCILCGRCIRVCSEIVANNTLDLIRRGWQTSINDPELMPLKNSNCLSCGACVQVCPTGAIYDRFSVYKARKAECDAVRTTCIECPMACDLVVYTRSNNIIKICGGEITGRYGGQLCKRGRFDLLFNHEERIKKPLIQDVKTGVKEVSFSEAIKNAVLGLRKLKEKFGEDTIAGVISTRCTNETLYLFREIMTRIIGTKNLFILEPKTSLLTYDAITRFHRGVSRRRRMEAKVSDILKADTIILTGFGSSQPHPIILSNIRRAVNQNDAKLVTISSTVNELTSLVNLQLDPIKGTEEAFFKGASKLVLDMILKSEEETPRVTDLSSNITAKKIEWVTGIGREGLEAFLKLITGGKKSIILVGGDLEPYPNVFNSILLLSGVMDRFDGRLPLLCQRLGGNSQGALDILYPIGVKSLDRDLRDLGIRGAYVILSDEKLGEASIAAKMMNLDFLVLQASYKSNLSLLANVVIPSLTWAEKEGSVTDMDGNLRQLNRVTKPPPNFMKDEDILLKISEGLKTELKYEEAQARIEEMYAPF